MKDHYVIAMTSMQCPVNDFKDILSPNEHIRSCYRIARYVWISDRWTSIEASHGSYLVHCGAA
jgi:hypothetical protein